MYCTPGEGNNVFKTDLPQHWSALNIVIYGEGLRICTQGEGNYVFNTDKLQRWPALKAILLMVKGPVC